MTKVEALKKMYMFLVSQATSPSEVAEYSTAILSVISPELCKDKSGWKTLVINYCDLDPQKWINEFLFEDSLFKSNSNPVDGDLDRSFYKDEVEIKMYNAKDNCFVTVAEGEWP